MTPKQKRAKARNFAKMRLGGMIATVITLCNATFISPREKIKLTFILRKLRDMKIDWDSESRIVFKMITTGSKKK